MMKFAYIAAILSVTLIAFDASAEPPGGQGGAKGKNASGQRSKGDRLKGARLGQGAGDRAQRDPAQLAARMMQEFDKNGDDKLSTVELTALLTSLRDRRGSGNQSGAFGAKGSRGQDARAKAKGRGKSRDGASNGPAGGQKPKRPTTE